MTALDGQAVRRLHAILESVPVNVAALYQLCNFLLTLKNHTEVGFVRGLLNRAVDQRFVVHHAARLDPAGGGDDRLGRAIVDTHGQLVGGKAAKDD